MSTSAASTSGSSNNLILAAILALLSYVPFETVAQGTLLVAFALFVWDPLPPVTRLLSILTVVVVAVLSRIHRHWLLLQAVDDTSVSSSSIAMDAAEDNDDQQQHDENISGIADHATNKTRRGRIKKEE